MKTIIYFFVLQANEKVTYEAKLASQAAADTAVGGGSVKELEVENEKLKKVLADKEKAMVSLSVKLEADIMKIMEDQMTIATL